MGVGVGAAVCKLERESLERGRFTCGCILYGCMYVCPQADKRTHKNTIASVSSCRIYCTYRKYFNHLVLRNRVHEHEAGE